MVYDHLGGEFSFFYKIEDTQIQKIEPNEVGRLGWLTEIPMFKLHRALFHGESLTSLYLRINDCIFESAIETEIVDVDIMNDPLLRCLYNGAIPSYQKEQLKRILI